MGGGTSKIYITSTSDAILQRRSGSGRFRPFYWQHVALEGRSATGLPLRRDNAALQAYTDAGTDPLSVRHRDVYLCRQPLRRRQKPHLRVR